ncbi:unnamed protein product, partial [Notodromas monacha]
LDLKSTRDGTEFLHWLHLETTQPRPLLRQARTVIRRCLSGDGSSIAKRTKQLPLPDTLKRYLLLNEKSALADADLGHEKPEIVCILGPEPRSLDPLVL